MIENATVRQDRYMGSRKASSLGSGGSRLAPVTLLSSSILRGCNIHHSNTVIRQSVDFGALSGKFSREGGIEFRRLFVRRFIDPVKTLPKPRINERFAAALESPEGAAFEAVLLEAILSIESQLAAIRNDFQPIGMAQAIASEAGHPALLVWESHVPTTSRAAARLGLLGLLELLPENLYASQATGQEDFEAAFAALRARVLQKRASATTSLLALTASRRGIPSSNRFGGPHLYLGQGSAQQLVYSSVPGDATHAALALAANKRKTVRRLAEVHLPVPQQVKVRSPEAALAAAKKLGYPLVVKPLKGHVGGGVTVGINEPDQLCAAYEFARSSGKLRDESVVVVETFVAGLTYRLLVIAGRFVAALKIVPPTVIGDGEKSIGQLIEAMNADPLRDNLRLYKVKVDDELIAYLSRSGFALDHVLEKGKEIAVRSASNVGIGGVHTDVTDIVHPANQEMAVRAAQAMGLTVAGIDFIAPDISRPYQESGGRIVEVNARPAFCMHVFPYHGQSRNPCEAMLDVSFPGGATGRIPSALVVGQRRTGAVAQELDAILRRSGKTTGVVTHRGVQIAGVPVPLEKSKMRDALPDLLRDPRIETVVATISPRNAVNKGITFDLVDVAAIMNPFEELDIALYREALRIVIASARHAVVADVTNKFAWDAMRAFEPARLILVADSLDDPMVKRHLSAGGRVVASVFEQEQDQIVIRRGRSKPALLPVAAPRAGRRPDGLRTKTRMYVLALALGMGLTVDQL